MLSWLKIARSLLGYKRDSASAVSPLPPAKVQMNYNFTYRPESRTKGGDYNYLLPDAYEGKAAVEHLIRRLAATKPFRRLQDIRFLGALDYCLVSHPNGSKSNVRYTRAQHSFGVASLAKLYLSTTERRLDDELLCIAAALLHDIGHAPFSHTLEPVLKENFGIDHHTASENIILGTEFSSEITDVLRDFGVKPERVVDVLNGRDEAFDGFFSGPINFDTIEGILRSRSYLRMQNLGLTPTRVLKAATSRNSRQDEAVVDAFWSCKDDVYNVVIRSKVGVLYDTIFQVTAQYCIKEFNRSDFYLTETQAFRKHPALKEAAQPHFWPKIVEKLFPTELSYQVRSFYIDESIDFFSYLDKDRYRQRKFDRSVKKSELLS